jgi:hypothetical protein
MKNLYEFLWKNLDLKNCLEHLEDKIQFLNDIISDINEETKFRENNGFMRIAPEYENYFSLVPVVSVL